MAVLVLDKKNWAEEFKKQNIRLFRKIKNDLILVIDQAYITSMVKDTLCRTIPQLMRNEGFHMLEASLSNMNFDQPNKTLADMKIAVNQYKNAMDSARTSADKWKMGGLMIGDLFGLASKAAVLSNQFNPDFTFYCTVLGCSGLSCLLDQIADNIDKAPYIKINTSSVPIHCAQLKMNIMRTLKDPSKFLFKEDKNAEENLYHIWFFIQSMAHYNDEYTWEWRDIYRMLTNPYSRYINYPLISEYLINFNTVSLKSQDNTFPLDRRSIFNEDGNIRLYERIRRAKKKNTQQIINEYGFHNIPNIESILNNAFSALAYFKQGIKGLSFAQRVANSVMMTDDSINGYKIKAHSISSDSYTALGCSDSVNRKHKMFKLEKEIWNNADVSFDNAKRFGEYLQKVFNFISEDVTLNAIGLLKRERTYRLLAFDKLGVFNKLISGTKYAEQRRDPNVALGNALLTQYAGFMSEISNSDPALNKLSDELIINVPYYSDLYGNIDLGEKAVNSLEAQAATFNNMQLIEQNRTASDMKITDNNVLQATATIFIEIMSGCDIYCRQNNLNRQIAAMDSSFIKLLYSCS